VRSVQGITFLTQGRAAGDSTASAALNTAHLIPDLRVRFAALASWRQQKTIAHRLRANPPHLPVGSIQNLRRTPSVVKYLSWAYTFALFKLDSSPLALYLLDRPHACRVTSWHPRA